MEYFGPGQLWFLVESLSQHTGSRRSPVEEAVMRQSTASLRAELLEQIGPVAWLNYKSVSCVHERYVRLWDVMLIEANDEKRWIGHNPEGLSEIIQIRSLPDLLINASCLSTSQLAESFGLSVVISMTCCSITMSVLGILKMGCDFSPSAQARLFPK